MKPSLSKKLHTLKWIIQPVKRRVREQSWPTLSYDQMQYQCQLNSVPGILLHKSKKIYRERACPCAYDQFHSCSLYWSESNLVLNKLTIGTLCISEDLLVLIVTLHLDHPMYINLLLLPWLPGQLQQVRRTGWLRGLRHHPRGHEGAHVLWRPDLGHL